MGKTMDYYRKNPKAYRAKLATDKKINARPEQRKKRSQLVKANRDRGTYGNGDGKDLHHSKNGKLVSMSQSKNRGMKGEGGRKKGKRKTKTIKANLSWRRK
jgi:hypothetical protein